MLYYEGSLVGYILINCEKNMVHTYEVKEVLWREIPEERHRLWDVLDKEDSIHILNKDPNLKYCREH